MKRIVFILLVSLIFFNRILAQPFVVQSDIELQGLAGSKAAWVDFDNDGDLDIFLTGCNGIGYSLLYRNNGNSTFTKIPDFKFVLSSLSSSAFGDYDSDGDVDIAITDNSHETFIYENSRNNSFTKNPYLKLSKSGYGSVDWGDFNNDGKIDLLLTGSNEGNNIAEVWMNISNKNFYKKNGTILKGVFNGSGKWGDYDNDGDLDILMSGGTNNSTTDFTIIYTNDGYNTFSKLTELCNYVGKAEWGDYNSDGYLDVIITGGRI